MREGTSRASMHAMRSVLVLVLGGVVVLACRAAPKAPNDAVSEPVALTAAVVVSSDEAVLRIADIRCAREVSCDRVGRGRRYQDSVACMNALGRDVTSEVGHAVCPRGIGEVDLGECISSLRDKPCSIAIDQLNRVAQCQRGELCLR